MHETSAQGWCTGKTQRDGMEREVGGGMGMGMGNTHLLDPWLIHVNVWQKPLQYCKVTSLQLIKINEKKKFSSLLCSMSRSLFPQTEAQLEPYQLRGDKQGVGAQESALYLGMDISKIRVQATLLKQRSSYKPICLG